MSLPARCPGCGADFAAANSCGILLEPIVRFDATCGHYLCRSCSNGKRRSQTESSHCECPTCHVRSNASTVLVAPGKVPCGTHGAASADAVCLTCHAACCTSCVIRCAQDRHDTVALSDLIAHRRDSRAFLARSLDCVQERLAAIRRDEAALHSVAIAIGGVLSSGEPPTEQVLLAAVAVSEPKRETAPTRSPSSAAGLSSMPRSSNASSSVSPSPNNPNASTPSDHHHCCDDGDSDDDVKVLRRSKRQASARAQDRIVTFTHSRSPPPPLPLSAVPPSPPKPRPQPGRMSLHSAINLSDTLLRRKAIVANLTDWCHEIAYTSRSADDAMTIAKALLLYDRPIFGDALRNVGGDDWASVGLEFQGTATAGFKRNITELVRAQGTKDANKSEPFAWWGIVAQQLAGCGRLAGFWGSLLATILKTATPLAAENDVTALKGLVAMIRGCCGTPQATSSLGPLLTALQLLFNERYGKLSPFVCADEQSYGGDIGRDLRQMFRCCLTTMLSPGGFDVSTKRTLVECMCSLLSSTPLELHETAVACLFDEALVDSIVKLSDDNPVIYNFVQLVAVATKSSSGPNHGDHVFATAAIRQRLHEFVDWSCTNVCVQYLLDGVLNLARLSSSKEHESAIDGDKTTNGGSRSTAVMAHSDTLAILQSILDRSNGVAGAATSGEVDSGRVDPATGMITYMFTWGTVAKVAFVLRELLKDGDLLPPDALTSVVLSLIAHLENYTVVQHKSHRTDDVTAAWDVLTEFLAHHSSRTSAPHRVTLPLLLSAFRVSVTVPKWPRLQHSAVVLSAARAVAAYVALSDVTVEDTVPAVRTVLSQVLVVCGRRPGGCNHAKIVDNVAQCLRVLLGIVRAKEDLARQLSDADVAQLDGVTEGTLPTSELVSLVAELRDAIRKKSSDPTAAMAVVVKSEEQADATHPLSAEPTARDLQDQILRCREGSSVMKWLRARQYQRQEMERRRTSNSVVKKRSREEEDAPTNSSPPTRRPDDFDALPPIPRYRRNNFKLQH